jgi:predicted phosphoribosyltransferase
MGVDEIICATTQEPFLGVGRWYEDFSQTADEEVSVLLEQARNEHAARAQQELAHSL